MATTSPATRFILQARPTLLAGLRVVPVAMLLIGAASAAAPAGATGCGPANVAVSGGTASNRTTVDLSADGGEAFSDAEGGNNNTASGGAGGAGGDGGDAAAGNGGVAVAEANGGMIDLDEVNSGDNAGNTIVASIGSAGCGSGARNVSIDGGRVSNETTVRLSADGGTAVANAEGGNNNTATGGAGGAGGDGGDAAAGNGGVAVAEANGGAVTVGAINSGGNSGNTIVVEGGQGGNVSIDGGTVSNETTIDISADGGTAVATADGGNNNTAAGGTGGAGGDGGDASAGNGGVAQAEANGGTVTIGDVNSGDNEGNTIIVGG